jgi:hypothetical protein
MLNLRALLFFVSTIVSSLGFSGSFDWNEAITLFDQKNHWPSDIQNGFGSMADCFVKETGYRPVATDANGNILQNCAPDTLYSWGPPIKLMAFLKHAPVSGVWDKRFKMDVFAHINPVATFGYGETPIRIKLKPTVNFKLIAPPIRVRGTCKDLAANEIENTVLIVAWNSGNGFIGTDYVICSPNVIHSWSTGTARHYDEIITSLIWTNIQIRAGHPNYWAGYAINNGNNIFYDSQLDDHDWSVPTHLEYLRQLHFMVEQNLGVISFNPSVKKQESDHFTSRQQIYWHWRRD